MRMLTIFVEHGIMVLLYLPTQIRLPIRGERVTCHGSKFTSSLRKQQLELSTRT